MGIIPIDTFAHKASVLKDNLCQITSIDTIKIKSYQVTHIQFLTIRIMNSSVLFMIIISAACSHAE